MMSQFQIEPYRGSRKKLDEAAVAFTGSPQSGADSGKVMLMSDPFSQQAFFYEFRPGDILYAEEMPGMSMPDASMVPMVRLWIKKGATALRIEPFSVQDTAAKMKDFF